MFFASSDVTRTSEKVSLQQRDIPLTINVSLNGCEWKKYVQKRLLKMFFDTADEALMG